MKKSLENFGIGIDIVEIERFRVKNYKKNKNFYEKIFAKSEIDYCLRFKDPYTHFAGKFALKESVIKSIQSNISFLDIQLLDLKHSIKDIEYDTFLSHSSIFNDEKNLIVSWHNFKSTPSTNSMENQIKKISTKLKHPEQIIKVVTYANSLNDCNKVFDLYPRFEKSKFQLLAFCMSETGSITRVLSPILGAPFIYCFTGTKSVAPGQINLNILKEIYSNFS